MHEASLIRDLIGKIEKIARAQKARKVVTVRVKLGALSHMSPEHFEEHFQQASPGTLAEGATLVTKQLRDIHHPQAQEIILESIEVVEEHPDSIM